MIDLLRTFLYQYIDLIISETTFEFSKLIDVLDINVILDNESFKTDFETLEQFYKEWEKNPNLSISIDLTTQGKMWTFYLEKVLAAYLEKIILNADYIIKFIVAVNILLVKIVFLWITPLTFWAVPTVFLFISGIILLFFIKPNGLNLKIWNRAKFLFLIALIYQSLLLSIFFYFFYNGLLLKVGYSLAFTSAYNISLIKLLAQFFVIASLLITLFFFVDFYKKNLLIIKPELVVILFFLGFGSNMVFFQNDLFSLFLYFEIISFCIYGLLFLQKWTNAQLHALIWYVLFSLWVSTCYILGTAFYISAYSTSTNLAYFWTVAKVEHINNLVENSTEVGHIYISDYFVWFPNILNIFMEHLQNDFEGILALTFILIYFLFKIGVGPFYTWTVEVYNACPTSTLFVVSILPKLIYFPMLFYILFFCFIEYWAYWSTLLLIIGIITIFIGAFGILLTDKLKEIYAWSSITHSGNLLIMLATLSSSTLTFLSFYLFSYYLTSFGFIALILCLKNRYTGKFIKSINEFGSLNLLNTTFQLSAIVILASAAGFTPFVSFFMKFSVLTLTAYHSSIFLLLVIGLLNIVGSIAYLRILRNLVGNNLNLFISWTRDNSVYSIELKVTYWMALIFNFLIIFITFGFIFYKDFLLSVNFFHQPIFISEECLEISFLKYLSSFRSMNTYLSDINICVYDYCQLGSKDQMPERDYCNPKYTDEASKALCDLYQQKQDILQRVKLHLECKDGRVVLNNMSLPSPAVADSLVAEAFVRIACHALNATEDDYYPAQLFAYATLARH